MSGRSQEELREAEERWGIGASDEDLQYLLQEKEKVDRLCLEDPDAVGLLNPFDT